jgi:hypothetical protein
MASENVQKVKLRDFGFIRSGNTNGDHKVLEAELNSIYQGKIIDESEEEVISDREQENYRTKINNLKSDNEIDLQKIAASEDIISRKKEDKERIQNDIDKIRLGEQVNNTSHETFSPLKFGVNLFFLLALSVYLFLFYVATTFKVFYVNAESVADEGGVSALPSPNELSEALSYNPLLLFAPFIFFGFGYAIHELLEKKSNVKYLYVTLVLLVTFFLDFLMAYKIHDNTTQALLMLTDEQPIPLFSDTTFYIIMVMGFVVYVIWSILLFSLMSEWKKRDAIGKRVDMINELEKIIEKLRIDINELNNIVTKRNGVIRNFEEIMNGVRRPVERISLAIHEFHTGWMGFLAGSDSLLEQKNKCEQVFEDFKKNKEL